MFKYVAEFLGTFCLVFIGTGAVVANEITSGDVTHVGVSLAFGLIVMAMIYSVGDISGAHINPAVTFGFWVSGRMKTRSVPGYIVAQCCGAIAASAVLLVLLDGSQEGQTAALSWGATLPREGLGVLQVFGIEVALTAILMFVILCVSTGPKEMGVMAGAAVGAVVAVEALACGPLTGASMNPARSLGPALISGRLEYLWLYMAAPVCGAIVSVPIFYLVRSRRELRLSESTE